MKKYIHVLLAAASLALIGCVTPPASSGTQTTASPSPEPPPQGWVCPQHGPNCPWATKRRYCDYYDRHGYGSWRGGNCCAW